MVVAWQAHPMSEQRSSGRARDGLGGLSDLCEEGVRCVAHARRRWGRAHAQLRPHVLVARLIRALRADHLPLIHSRTGNVPLPHPAALVQGAVSRISKRSEWYADQWHGGELE